MKIAIRGGHTPFCKGAMGFRDEQVSMWELTNHVIDVLRKYGHEVVNCNPTTRSTNMYDEMKEAHKIAHNFNADIFITLHMNASNGQGHGSEAWLYSNVIGSTISDIAYRLCWHYEQMGLRNRGVKVNPEFYDLKNTVMPALIFETLFCDNQHDINIWANASWEELSRRIANAIDPSIPLEEPKPEPIPESCEEIHKVKVNDVQVGAYRNHDNVINVVKENIGKGKIEIS